MLEEHDGERRLYCGRRGRIPSGSCKLHDKGFLFILSLIIHFASDRLPLQWRPVLLYWRLLLKFVKATGDPAGVGPDVEH